MKRSDELSSRSECFRALGLFASLIGSKTNNRVELWVELLDPGEMRIHKFDRRQFPLADESSHFGCGLEQEINGWFGLLRTGHKGKLCTLRAKRVHETSV